MKGDRKYLKAEQKTCAYRRNYTQDGFYEAISGLGGRRRRALNDLASLVASIRSPASIDPGTLDFAAKVVLGWHDPDLCAITKLAWLLEFRTSVGGWEDEIEFDIASMHADLLVLEVGGCRSDSASSSEVF